MAVFNRLIFIRAVIDHMTWYNLNLPKTAPMIFFPETEIEISGKKLSALQMFAGIYGDFTGK